MSMSDCVDDETYSNRSDSKLETKNDVSYKFEPPSYVQHGNESNKTSLYGHDYTLTTGIVAFGMHAQ